jgi:hypothetical protein
VSAIKVTVTDTVVKHYLELDKGVSYLINDFCFINILVPGRHTLDTVVSFSSKF